MPYHLAFEGGECRCAHCYVKLNSEGGHFDHGTRAPLPVRRRLFPKLLSHRVDADERPRMIVQGQRRERAATYRTAYAITEELDVSSATHYSA